ncbi:MAG TPA: DUF4129 domain-containing protein [Methylomirabilota bacterium]|nr:DUF4129 domain-containing protein [Methylomirabilota bacterium]
MKRRNPETMLGGLDLLEEAVHVLRLASPATFLCYYAGTVPFVLAVLFFWSDMSRSGFAEQHLVGGAIALGLLFVWMKIWQSAFTRKLSAQLANEPLPKISAGAFVRLVASQTLIQSTGLFFIPLAAQVLLPLAWVYTFYQNVTVLGFSEPSLAALVRRSWKQARFAPVPCHSALLLLSVFGMFVFLDVVIVMLAAPHLLKMLAGTETSFTLNAWSSLNSTFFAAAVGVTYLCLDPLLKALYTLRCFYGESRATGEDLRVTLRSFRGATAIAIVCFAALVPTVSAQGPAPKAAPPGAPMSDQGTALDRSINEVLKRPEYTWRSPRPKPEEKPKTEATMLKRIREWVRDGARSVLDFFEKLFRSRRPPAMPGKVSFTAENLIYVLIGLVLVTIGVLVWLLWKSRTRSNEAELEATPAAPLPDLASDDVAGDELPVDGWAQLALELLQRGELRLAMRAFYFSSLAHLAARNLVSIAKFKSNRDYERELLRRSHAVPELSQTFSQNVSVFDRVWYGMHDINADLLQQFRANVERIRSC